MVAFIPTGLPVAVTLSLLLMARKMAKHRVLVKNLATIETLSCVNVIAWDKTGTLTQNKMYVSNAVAGMEQFDKANCEKRTLAFKQLVALAALCNDASFVEDESNLKLPICQRKTNGDATDTALLKFSAENSDNEKLACNYNVLSEIPFNSKNKWMMKVVLAKDLDVHNRAFDEDRKEIENLMLLKGAPDKLLMKCKTILQPNGVENELNDLMRINIIKMQNDWCILGQRVLLLCKKNLTNDETANVCVKGPSDIEKYVNELEDFCLVGMVGIIDPPREGISDVIAKCRRAGIRVLMVTGNLYYINLFYSITTSIGLIRL